MLREHKVSNEEEHVKRTWNETSEALIALCQVPICHMCMCIALC